MFSSENLMFGEYHDRTYILNERMKLPRYFQIISSKWSLFSIQDKHVLKNSVHEPYLREYC